MVGAARTRGERDAGVGEQASGVCRTSSCVARGGDIGYLQSKLLCDHCVNHELVRPTRIPPRQSAAAKAVYTHPGGATQGPIATYAVSSAGRAESLGLQGRIILSPVHRTFVSGCEGPSIAELRNVLVV